MREGDTAFIMFLRRLVILAYLLGLSACSVHVGPTMEVPSVPAPTVKPGEGRDLKLGVSLGSIKDARSSATREDTSSPEGKYTEPAGDVAAAVKTALASALADQGVRLRPNAPLTIFGEVRRWRTQAAATTTTSIHSEAALYVEVVDRSGNRVYSGTYHGSRASEFPIATLSDIKESLGLAMSEAIAQLFDDEEFITALWKQ